MLEDVADRDMDPGRLNRHLCRSGGYVSGNLMSFGALEAFGLSGVVVDCYDRPAPIDRVEAVLAARGGVLALVDFVPGGSVNQHWVRVLRLVDGDAWLCDPWLPAGTGGYWMMPKYAHHTWADVGRSIFRLAMYVPMVDGNVLVDMGDENHARDSWQRAIFALRED